HCASYLPLTPRSHPLSLHDALPILRLDRNFHAKLRAEIGGPRAARDDDIRGGKRFARHTHAGHAAALDDEAFGAVAPLGQAVTPDRKSTRLNSSHVKISYAVFCLKK